MLFIYLHRNEGFAYQKEFGFNDLMPNYDPVIEPQFPPLQGHGRFPIYYLDEYEVDTADDSGLDAIPIWQTSPVLKRNWANRNILRDPSIFVDKETNEARNIGDEALRCLESEQVVVSGFHSASEISSSPFNSFSG